MGTSLKIVKTILTVDVDLLEHGLKLFGAGKLPQGPHNSSQFFLGDAPVPILVEQPERFSELCNKSYTDKNPL